MEYTIAPDLQIKMLEIVSRLKFTHVDTTRVVCMRSRGSSSRRVIARIHGLSKPVQLAMSCKPFYVIEFLERFERCSDEEKIQTIIHELMHIPHNFGGGFRQHNLVKSKHVKVMYERYVTTLHP